MVYDTILAWWHCVLPRLPILPIQHTFFRMQSAEVPSWKGKGTGKDYRTEKYTDNQYDQPLIIYFLFHCITFFIFSVRR